MSVNAVFFDVGNTLVAYYAKEDFAPVLERCVINALDILKTHGLMFEPAVIMESAHQYNIEREDLVVTPLEERLAALFSLKSASDPLMPELVKAFMAPNLALANVNPGALETLSTLKNAGYITGIISNTPWGSSRDMWSKQLSELGLAEYIDHQVYCMDVGVRKPHPAIFQHAFDLSGVIAGESLFIGDDPVWDVVGAQGVGMKVFLFDPAGQQTTSENVTIKTIQSLPEILPLLENM